MVVEAQGELILIPKRWVGHHPNGSTFTWTHPLKGHVWEEFSRCVFFFHMSVSKNSGTPKSCILIGFSIINHPFWGTTIFGNTHMNVELMDGHVGRWPQLMIMRLWWFRKNRVTPAKVTAKGTWKYHLARKRRNIYTKYREVYPVTFLSWAFDSLTRDWVPWWVPMSMNFQTCSIN